MSGSLRGPAPPFPLIFPDCQENSDFFDKVSDVRNLARTGPPARQVGESPRRKGFLVHVPAHLGRPYFVFFFPRPEVDSAHADLYFFPPTRFFLRDSLFKQLFSFVSLEKPIGGSASFQNSFDPFPFHVFQIPFTVTCGKLPRTSRSNPRTPPFFFPLRDRTWADFCRSSVGLSVSADLLAPLVSGNKIRARVPPDPRAPRASRPSMGVVRTKGPETPGDCG